jgi:minor extracellular protease Epr
LVEVIKILERVTLILLRLTKSKVLISIVLVALILTVSFSGFTSIGSAQPAERVSVIIGFRNFQDDKSVGDQGGVIKYSYGYIRAIAASVPPQAIDALQRNPNVAYVETDFKVYALQQPIPWGIAKIRAPQVWVTGNKGTGIKVAIIDTGIETHPDLNVVGGATFVAGTSSYTDDNGHGTHCAGIVTALDNDIGVVGVAPEAALYAVKVLDRSGSGYLSDVIKGIEWCITNNMQVVSMSFGSTSDSTSLHAECDKAYNSGIVLVAAAGNSGPRANTIGYPAKYSSVIAVGATDSNDAVASWSSRGPELSVTAPGVSIYSTYKGGVYATMSGTSMACPHVTGTVALILAKAAHTPVEVRDILQKTAVDLGTPGRDSSYGYGRIDAYAASVPATPDFSNSASPSALTINAGASGTSTITVTSLNTFSGAVSLTVSGPAGWSASPSLSSLTVSSGGSASSTLTITVPSTTKAGAYAVTVTGTSDSLSHSATVIVNVQTAPSAPQNLKATAGDAKVTLSWSAPLSDGGSAVTNYKIYRGTTSGGKTELTTLGNVLTYTDTSVTNGQTYYYQVTAVNSIGESEKSSEAYATPSSVKTLSVAVVTDKATYSRGSNVRITVTVKDSATGNGLPGALVKVTVYNPSGSVAWTGSGTTGSSGTVRFNYGVGRSAPKGAYNVVATASLTGYQTGTGQTTFKVA